MAAQGNGSTGSDWEPSTGKLEGQQSEQCDERIKGEKGTDQIRTLLSLKKKIQWSKQIHDYIQDGFSISGKRYKYKEGKQEYTPSCYTKTE